MQIILSAGMQSINIAVELINDTIFENNEMFQGILTIISEERVSLDPGTASATIIEDEGMYMYIHTMLYFQLLIIIIQWRQNLSFCFVCVVR